MHPHRWRIEKQSDDKPLEISAAHGYSNTQGPLYFIILQDWPRHEHHSSRGARVSDANLFAIGGWKGTTTDGGTWVDCEEIEKRYIQLEWNTYSAADADVSRTGVARWNSTDRLQRYKVYYSGFTTGCGMASYHGTSRTGSFWMVAR